MPNKRVLASSLLGLGLLAAPRANAIVLTSLEPVIGYERVQKLVPTPHTHDRLVYGGRFTAGLLLLSVEGEYLRGMDSETFPGLTTRDTTDKAKLGLRSTIRLVGLVHLYLRAGGQASRNKHEETDGSGVTTSTIEPVQYHPYAGAGLRVRLGHSFAINGDLTTVFHNFPNMNDNEYQATASLAIEIP